MKWLEAVFLPALFLGCLVLQGRAAVPEDLISRIARNLKCVCPCSHLLNVCGDECEMAPQQTAEIRQLLAEGKTEEEVYASLEKKHGVRVLAEPKPEGFNLLAWAAPLAAVLGGAGIVIVVVRKLKPTAPPISPEDAQWTMDEKYRRLLEKELKE